jgi:hypothetical protein
MAGLPDESGGGLTMARRMTSSPASVAHLLRSRTSGTEYDIASVEIGRRIETHDLDTAKA